MCRWLTPLCPAGHLPRKGGDQGRHLAPTKNPESVSASGVLNVSPCGGWSVLDGHQRAGAGGGGFLDGVLHLFEGADFDLADALAGDVELR